MYGRTARAELIAPTTTWVLRKGVYRSLVSWGRPCDYCGCAICQGGYTADPLEWPSYSYLCQDGSRICATCYHYPPCGEDGDCHAFITTHECTHRPALDPSSRSLVSPPNKGAWMWSSTLHALGLIDDKHFEAALNMVGDLV